MRIEDPYLRAIIDASIANERTNPAVAADTEYAPSAWTPEMERDLVERLHGTDAERLDALIAEANERLRKS